MLVPVCASVHVCLCLFISPLSKRFTKHSAYLRALCPCRKRQRDNCFLCILSVRKKNKRQFYAMKHIKFCQSMCQLQQVSTATLRLSVLICVQIAALMISFHSTVHDGRGRIFCIKICTHMIESLHRSLS